MDVTIRKTAELSFRLEIEASAEDMKPEIDRRMRERRSRLDLNGFRTGKVPLAIVRQLYGREIEDEAVDHLLAECFEDMVTHSPDFEHWSTGPDLTAYREVSYTYGGELRARIPFVVRPVFTVQVPDRIEVEFPDQDIGDKILDALVTDLLDGNGSAEVLDSDAVLEHGDRITYDLREMDSYTEVPLLGTAACGRELTLTDFSKDAGDFEAKLCGEVIGKKVGEVVRIRVENETAEVLEGESEEWLYEAAITGAVRRVPAELSDELARRVSKNPECTRDVLMSWIHVLARNYLAQYRRSRILTSIRKQFCEMNEEFPIPEFALETKTSKILQFAYRYGGLDPKESDFGERVLHRSAANAAIAKYLRWMFCREELTRQHGISIGEDKLRRRTRVALLHAHRKARLCNESYPPTANSALEELGIQEATALADIRDELIICELQNRPVLVIDGDTVGLKETLEALVLFDVPPEDPTGADAVKAQVVVNE